MFKAKLTYAEARLNEAAENGTAQDCAYWRGYRDAIRTLDRALTVGHTAALPHPPAEVSRR